MPVAPKKINSGFANSQSVALANWLERLRKDFELFFANQIPFPPPESEVKKFEKAILKCMNDATLSKQEMFKLRSIACTFNQMKDYWCRVLKEIEAGTYFRQAIRSRYKSSLEEFERKKTEKLFKLEQTFENLYLQYLELGGSNVRKEDFIKRIKSLYEKVKRQNANRKIKISLVKTTKGVTFKLAPV
ncbi:MAG: hypothetical protein NZT61_00680 [Deltaproteobacteria bacterium]|nr:hypothetical protein [Deltaproteobacteria bacterium]